MSSRGCSGKWAPADPMRRQLIPLTALFLTLAAAATAAPSAGPTLKATPATIEYGKGEIVLSGVVAGKRAGEEVTILSQACRFTEPAPIATVKTKAGGAFTFRVQPMLNTSFRARTDAGTSAAVRIGVKPIVSVRRIRANRFRIEIQTTNPVFLDGRTAVLQRKVGARWVVVKSVKLVKASPETAITVLSAATFTATATGVVRAVLPAAQAGCYLGAVSAEIAA